MVNKERLQAIIDTLESNGSIDHMLEYFDKQVSYHRDQVRRAQIAIDQHQLTLDRHEEYLKENEAIAQAFRTLKEEE